MQLKTDSGPNWCTSEDPQRAKGYENKDNKLFLRSCEPFAATAAWISVGECCTYGLIPGNSVGGRKAVSPVGVMGPLFLPSSGGSKSKIIERLCRTTIIFFIVL